jgi:Putative Actinobacterial Holin-X, holin superfamily III
MTGPQYPPPGGRPPGPSPAQPTGAVPPASTPPQSGGYSAPPPGAPAREAPGRREDVGELSVGQLVGDVTRDLSTLMRQELALARAEFREEAAKTAKGAGAFGGAGFAGYMAVLFLSIALWWALAYLVGHGWSALIVAALWGIAAAVLAVTGRQKLREVHPTPERTVDTLKQVPDALRGERGGTR